MNARHLLIYLLLSIFCVPQVVLGQPSAAKDSANACMRAAEGWRLKGDTARSNLELRKAIAVYKRNGYLREAAEAWLTMENYYAFFHGSGYGPRIAYYEQGLKLFNRAHVEDRAFDTRKVLGSFYTRSAMDWRARNDSAKCNADIRKAIDIYLKNGQMREAAESWLTLENCFAYFQGRGLGPRIAYYKRALELFKKANVNDRAAATLTILGDFYQLEGRNAEALAVLNQSLDMYKKSDKIDLQRLYSVLGIVSTKMGNMDKALEYNLLGVKAAEVSGDTTLMVSSLLNSVGLAYMGSRNFSKAYNYYGRALAEAKKKKALNSIILLSCNLARAMDRLDRRDEAYKLLLETQKTYHPADLASRAVLNISLLGLLTNAKRYGEAKKYCDTLLRLESQFNGIDFRKAGIWYGVSSYFLGIRNFARAREYANKCEHWSARDHNRQALLSALALQYKIDSVQGNINEIKSFRRFIKLRDTLFSATKTWQVAQVDIAYQTEQKDQQIRAKEANIAMLSKQARLQATNLQQQKTAQKLVICGAVLLAMLLGLSYNRYRLKQRVNRQLQQQQSEINEQNRSLTKLIAEKDNLLEEKEWLMKEIHHRVKNNLQIVISLLNTQSSFMEDPVAYQAIRESQHRMQSISLIHQKLYQSDNLSMVSMPAYISDLVRYLNGSFDIGGRIDFQLEIADIQLGVTKCVPLGLILNEAITNSLKYAFPGGRHGTIRIALALVGTARYELAVSDNGVGMSDQSGGLKNKTLGMSLMRGLSKQLSGTFSITDSHGIRIIVGFNPLSS